MQAEADEELADPTIDLVNDPLDRCEVLALGVVEEFRATGLAAGFYATLVQNARKLGFGDCEMSWILEDNVLMNRSLEVMGAKRYKAYRIYEWN